MITTPVGPTFMQNDGQSGARSGDHTHHHDRIKAWPDEGLTAVKVGELSAREGVVAPERTLHRYALAERGHGRRPKITVRLADGEPGDELQVDFGRMGLVSDSGAGR